MRARESDMPEETFWESFFDADCIVRKLECAKNGDESIAEFGSGYGTFTLPVARRTSGIVLAFDIDAEMVDLVNRKVQWEGLANVQVEMRDFVLNGTGLPSESIDHAMVYNLLHLEDPVRLLHETYRILRPGGYSFNHPLEVRSIDAAGAVDGNPSATGTMQGLGGNGRLCLGSRSGPLPVLRASLRSVAATPVMTDAIGNADRPSVWALQNLHDLT